MPGAQTENAAPREALRDADDTRPAYVRTKCAAPREAIARGFLLRILFT